jgi:hypothetical protein
MPETKKEIEKLLDIANHNYVNLLKWLYFNHRDVLNQYESEGRFKMEIEE